MEVVASNLDLARASALLSSIVIQTFFILLIARHDLLSNAVDVRLVLADLIADAAALAFQLILHVVELLLGLLEARSDVSTQRTEQVAHGLVLVLDEHAHGLQLGLNRVLASVDSSLRGR